MCPKFVRTAFCPSLDSNSPNVPSQIITCSLSINKAAKYGTNFEKQNPRNWKGAIGEPSKRDQSKTWAEKSSMQQPWKKESIVLRDSSVVPYQGGKHRKYSSIHAKYPYFETKSVLQWTRPRFKAGEKWKVQIIKLTESNSCQISAVQYSYENVQF